VVPVKEQAITVTGVVVKEHRNEYEVDCVTHLARCTGAKLALKKIRLTLGDTVEVELSPYDLARGRIVYRL